MSDSLTVYDEILNYELIDRLRIAQVSPTLVHQIEKRIGCASIFDLLVMWSLAETNEERKEHIDALMDECSFLSN